VLFRAAMILTFDDLSFDGTGAQNHRQAMRNNDFGCQRFIQEGTKTVTVL